MLFYSQIKREFSPTSWRRGQVYFREERVSDVKLDGDLIMGKVQGTDEAAYETAIMAARGAIFNSKCSCPAHRLYETHCKHVAALGIWVVERGSLLRTGVVESSYGVGTRDLSNTEVVFKDEEGAKKDVRLRALLRVHSEVFGTKFIVRRDLMAGSVQGTSATGDSFAFPVTLVEAAALLDFVRPPNEVELTGPAPIAGEPVLYVRGLFQSKVLTALTVESGIRYRDPQTKAMQINTLTYLTRQKQAGLWKTTQGLLVQVPPFELLPDDEVNFIQKMDSQKLIYQGQQALENLAKLLTHKLREQIVFDRAVDVKVETRPLKLLSFNVGNKSDKNRLMTYEFMGPDGEKISSDELSELAKVGRLSSHYVWRTTPAGDKIYCFETSLAQLYQYANRTGVQSTEAPVLSTGFGALYDDSDHPLHPITVYRLSLELGVKEFNVDSNWEEFHEWKKNFEKKKLPVLPTIEYGFDLREYQHNGLSWLWSLYHRGLGALLADEMGLGKTHQVLAFLSSLYQKKSTRPKQPTLVVAPTSVIAAWSQKLKKYDTGLRCHVFHGSSRKFPESGVDVVLTTYGILQREQALRDRDWHIVVLDEAQAIKNAGTLNSRASRTLKSKYRIAMTGTPIENQSTDLWSLMEFLLPGYMGSLPRFKRLYGWGREAPPDVQAQALKRMVSPFILRRTKAQVLKELPEKTEEVISCDMTKIQRKAYRACLSGAEAERARDDLRSGKKVDYANILVLLTRLKQICNHPKLSKLTSGKVSKLGTINPSESGKWETFVELIDEAVGSGLKVVVFTQYLGMIDLIAHFLKERKVGHTELRGDTPDRAARMERFAEDPECKVFLCSLLAGGLGIDLTAGSVCIHFDRWWNPARENQATDRLHRYGQTRGVQVFKLQTPGSVEERIAGIIESKVALSGALIEESSLGLKAFSRKELLDLLTPVRGGDGDDDDDDSDEVDVLTSEDPTGVSEER